LLPRKRVGFFQGRFMTTIAYKEGWMAADTQATFCETKHRTHKLRRLPCGGVIGGCGPAAEVVRAMEWVIGGMKGKAPKLRDSYLVIAFGDGRVVTVEDKHWTMLEANGPVSSGSGHQAALVAMRHFDASAEEAIHAAASVDIFTSAPVDTMRVEPKPKAGKKK
jgi:ATP-dependent protease HslVU (ClpYQ) peptidase subunit